MATLNRTLTLRDLILIVIGTVIGSGIFLVPGAVLRQTGGSVGVALLVWLAAGVLSLLGALTYGEMGASKPDAGGLYVYLRDALGPLPAFLYGWTMFFVIGADRAQPSPSRSPTTSVSSCRFRPSPARWSRC